MYPTRMRPRFVRQRLGIGFVAMVMVVAAGLVAGIRGTADARPINPYIPCDQWQQMHPGWPCWGNFPEIEEPTVPGLPAGPPSSAPPAPQSAVPATPPPTTQVSPPAAALTPPSAPPPLDPCEAIIPVPGYVPPALPGHAANAPCSSSGSAHRGVPVPIIVPAPHLVDSGYPLNEILMAPHDQFGDEVPLRRGYYDPATNSGFGFDKMFHKHGITNPNVFDDIIRHTPPTYQIDPESGQMRRIYRTQIQRWRCGSFLGIPTSCRNTGESVWIRAVVDVEDEKPDGRPQGLITMYCEKGGSGVTLNQWGTGTLCPNWVNTNVPIN